jgi:hypothetical protein
MKLHPNVQDASSFRGEYYDIDHHLEVANVGRNSQ